MSIARRPSRRPRPGLEALEARRLLTLAGGLDPSFGGGAGYVTSPLAYLVAAQPDGKIVEAGTSYVNGESSLDVARLNRDGTVDASFHGGSPVVLAHGASSSTAGIAVAVRSVLIQPDGKILVIGQDTIQSRANPAIPATVDRDAVFRLNTDGSLDTTFGTGGEAGFGEDFYTDFPEVTAAALGPDGKIILAGLVGARYPNVTPSPTIGVARLNADGSLDKSFGGTGMVATPLVVNGFTRNTVDAVAVQADGKVVVAGSAFAGQIGNFPHSPETDYYDGFAIRFDAAGKLDTAFGGTASAGKVLIPPDVTHPTTLGQAAEQGVIIQPDGKILLGGVGYGAFNSIVTRLDSDGAFDTTFGTGGQARFPVVLTTGVSLALQADGKIVLAAASYKPLPDNRTDYFAQLFRLNPDGSSNLTFGDPTTPGLSTIHPGGESFYPGRIALQADGRIVVPGSIRTFTGTTFTDQNALARVLATRTPTANEQPAADFDGDGRSDLAVYLPAVGAFAYRPSAGGPDVVVPFGVGGPGGTIPAVGDYTGSGHAEVAAYLPGPGLYAYRPAGGGPDVVQPFGIAGVGGSLPAVGDYTGSGRDDLALYLPSLGAFAIRPAGGGPDRIIPFGIAGSGESIPAPGDYDGDGRTDLAVYLPSLGTLAYRPSAGGPDVLGSFGSAGFGRSIPAPGDFDGDGKTDPAVYLPVQALFAYRPSGGGPDVLLPFGRPNDGLIPAAGDYSGSGRDQVAIFDPNFALFAFRPAGGTDVLTHFGAAGFGQSIPVTGPMIVGPGAVRSPSVPAFRVSASVPSGPGLAMAARRVARPLVAQTALNPGEPTA